MAYTPRIGYFNLTCTHNIYHIQIFDTYHKIYNIENYYYNYYHYKNYLDDFFPRNNLYYPYLD